MEAADLASKVRSIWGAGWWRYFALPHEGAFRETGMRQVLACAHRCRDLHHAARQYHSRRRRRMSNRTTLKIQLHSASDFELHNTPRCLEEPPDSLSEVHLPKIHNSFPSEADRLLLSLLDPIVARKPDESLEPLWRADSNAAIKSAQNVSARIKPIDVPMMKADWARERDRLCDEYDRSGSEKALAEMIAHTSDKRLHTLQKDQEFLSKCLQYCQVMTLPQTWAELKATHIPKSTSNAEDDDLWKQRVATWDEQAENMSRINPNIIIETVDHHIVLWKVQGGIDGELKYDEVPLHGMSL
jgi:hypothetical protein